MKGFSEKSILFCLALVFLGGCGSGRRVGGKAGEGESCKVDDDCQEGLVCREGVCSKEVECPEGRLPCGDVCCKEGQMCRDSTCVDECDTVECNGFCCDAGQLCTQEGCCRESKYCNGHCCADDEQCDGEQCVQCDRPLCDGVCCGDDELCHAGICCKGDKICGVECCGEDQVCEFGECHRDCGELVRCGEDEMCCQADEVCYFGQCIAPGEECDDPYDCLEDEFCDVELGRCLPRRETTECEYRPPVGEFNPVEEWAWTGGDVMMTPAVGNLTDDNGDTVIDEEDIPDIVFTVFYGGQYNFDGTLYVISGDDGDEHLVLSSYMISPAAGVAIGDVDGDTFPDIVACKSRGGLYVFNNDGSLKWEIPEGCPPRGIGHVQEHPVIADLDGDTVAEIVTGYVVISGGSFRCRGWDDYAILTAASDVDGDGFLDVVGGNRAMDRNCNQLWMNDSIPDGYPAIADVDLDGFPEVVVVANEIWILDGATGVIEWGPYHATDPKRPGGICGGAPTIADFDGDGKPEIATAGLDHYVVFDLDCSPAGSPADCASGRDDGKLWVADTQDHSSCRTGSSVFDFEGDGAAEVVYGDEYNLRIYRGIDGAVLFEVANSSGTLWEYPLIVDVDNDEHAEIVVVSNNYVWGTNQGVRVFGDVMNNWVRTRKIWNQHTYHVTNVEEDGQIPARETPNWSVEGLNNFRQNVQPEGLFNAPDLIPVDTMVDTSLCSRKLVLYARVLNQGSSSAPAGVPVAFYNVVDAETSVLLGVVHTTRILLPGESVVVSMEFEVPVGGEGENYEFYVIVDDDGIGGDVVHECREDNNISDRFSGYCVIPG